MIDGVFLEGRASFCACERPVAPGGLWAYSRKPQASVPLSRRGGQLAAIGGGLMLLYIIKEILPQSAGKDLRTPSL
jgi:hypothetical protein